MSDSDSAKGIGAKYDTMLTIATVPERIHPPGEQFDARVTRFEERVEVRLDRIESAVHETKSNSHASRVDFNEMHADFRDFKKGLREHFPFIK